MILNVEGEHGDGIRYEGSGRLDFCSRSCVHSLLANEVSSYRACNIALMQHIW